MKKIISISIALFIILNTFGSIALFYYTKKVIRKEMKTMLRDNPPLEKLELIKVPKHTKSFQRIDNFEFRLQGKMYDIFKEEIRNDTTFFYCVNDTKEEALFASFSNLNNENTSKSVLNNSLKNAFNFMFLGAYLEEKSENSISYYSSLNNYLYDDIYNSLVLDVNSPPPKPFIS